MHQSRDPIKPESIDLRYAISIIFTIVLVVGTMSTLYKKIATPQPSQDNTEYQQTKATNDTPVNGAIGFIKEQELETKALRAEAKGFGITFSSQKIDAYNNFRKRILTNDELAEALRIAKQERVQISLGDRFSVYSALRLVVINVRATDEEIIQFLVGRVPDKEQTEK